MPENEFDFYKKHQEELFTKYIGKYIVIKDQEVIGSYEIEIRAALQTSIIHDFGTLLVQSVNQAKKITLLFFIPSF